MDGTAHAEPSAFCEWPQRVGAGLVLRALILCSAHGLGHMQALSTVARLGQLSLPQRPGLRVLRRWPVPWGLSGDIPASLVLSADRWAEPPPHTGVRGLQWKAGWVAEGETEAQRLVQGDT